MIKKILMLFTFLLAVNAYAGQSHINWESPEKYADIFPSIENKHSYQAELFKDFETHFQQLAARLPDGYDLYINVNNLDLAGAISFANSHKIRIVDPNTPPRIEFKFQVIDNNNKVVASRPVYLFPKNFKFQRSLKVNRPYYHDFALITDWFENTFAPILSKK